MKRKMRKSVLKLLDKNQPVDINKLRRALYKKRIRGLSNLEHISLIMALRKAMMEKGYPDPFLPKSISVTDQDIVFAN